jgi:hypothetical protein
MKMDVISLILGFIIGVIVVGIAVEFGTKKRQNNSPSSKHTKNWDISELSNPRIMAEYLGDIKIPKNTKVIVNKFKDIQNLKGLDVRKNNQIKGNYIIGDDRALILSGPLKKDEIGFWTIEKEIVENLNNEFFKNWTNGSKLDFDEK